MDQPSPMVTAILRTGTQALADSSGMQRLAAHDQVELTIIVAPRS